MGKKNLTQRFMGRMRSMQNQPLWMRLPLALLLLAGLSAVGYWGATKTGPYNWFYGVVAELYAGTGARIMTIALLAIAILIPLLVIVFVAAGRAVPRPSGFVELSALVAAPQRLMQETVVYGEAKKVNWPEAQVTLDANGVTLSRDGKNVHCPWPIFASGAAELADTSLILPIKPSHVLEVTISQGNRMARGHDVHCRFFRFQGDTRVKCSPNYPGPLDELGEAIMKISRHYGA